MKLPRLTAKELVSVLLKLKFKLVRQSGSHKIYKNEDGVRITIPFHEGKILHPKIIKSILRDLDMSAEELQ